MTEEPQHPAGMKILFMAPIPPPFTGNSIAAGALLDALKERHCMEVIDFNNKGTLKQGVTSLSRIVQVCVFFKRALMERKRADVIYLTLSQSVAGNLKDLVIYSICFKKLGSMVIHLHGGGIRKLIFDRFRVLRRINRFFLRRMGSVVVLSKSLVPVFEGMVRAERIQVVPNFVDDSLFATMEDIKRKFLNRSPLRILFLSNLIPGKGFDELADAYLLLDRDVRRQVRIDFAGEFESEPRKKRFLKKIADIEGLHYHGVALGEMKRRLLFEAHLFCLPTYYAYEGQPISILEAYAAGCAVVTTDHGGIADVFEPGKTGFYVAQKSAASIADVIRVILSHPEQLEPIAVHNHMLAKTYSKPRYLSSMVRILEHRCCESIDCHSLP